MAIIEEVMIPCSCNDNKETLHKRKIKRKICVYVCQVCNAEVFFGESK